MKTAQLIRERALPIVFGAVDPYLLFRSDVEKKSFSSIAADLLIKVSIRIDSGDTISISELKPELFSSVYTFSFDTKTLFDLVKLVWAEARREISRIGVSDPESVKEFNRYEVLILEALGDVSILVRSETVDFLKKIEGYSQSRFEINLGSSESRLLSRNRAEEDASIPYRSRLRERFDTVFKKKVEEQRGRIFSAAYDINQVISDSSIKIPDPEEVDLDLLTATFGGEGKKIYDSTIEILSKATEIAGYQGSYSGSLEYQAMFYEYLMAMSYGKTLSLGSLGGDFGNFERIYGEKSQGGEITGVKFLEPLYETRSANQSEVKSLPLSDKFLGKGIENRFNDGGSGNISFGSLILESVYGECLKLGDSINSILNKEPVGIGDVVYICNILQSIFPPSVSFRGREEGLTGAVYKLLTSYQRLYSLTSTEPDLGGFFEKISELSQSVQVLSLSVKSAGFRSGGGGIVASLDLKIHTPSREKSRRRLLELGFTGYETDQILSASDFSELLERFSPMTTSSDVISFFRAFELTKLIYEFGGQESIDQYVNFLYGVDESGSLLRLLDFLERKRSMASKVIFSKYSKLIGYLITLTYAINPDQLVKLNAILAKNNLNLFESITYLLRQEKTTIIKDKSQLSLLSGMVAQMVISDNSDYQFGKSLWNDLISRSSGNSGDLTGIYDKVGGIIPEELNDVLRGPSATSPLGQLMDGVRGGNLTTVLRYCNILGILYQLSGYRNSGQLINKKAEGFEPILRTVSTMDTLSERLNLAYHVFRSNSVVEIKPVETYSDPLITAQNKPFEAIVGVIRGETTVSDLQPIDPPGIGNSRFPNGVRMSNSLSPEEARILNREVGGGSMAPPLTGERATGSGFVRFSVDNMLASGLSGGSGGSAISTGEPSKPYGSSPVSEFQTDYVVRSSSAQLVSSPVPFSPTQSCKKFGGKSCEFEEDKLCGNGYNKSSSPETGYGESLIPGVDNALVAVDRPLGQSLSGEKTNNAIDPSSAEYYFTQYGLNRASRAGLLKPTEMLCASLDDPFQYSACISLLKCKKFRPPYLGKYSLPYCPTTLQGGRNIR